MRRSSVKSVSSRKFVGARSAAAKAVLARQRALFRATVPRSIPGELKFTDVGLFSSALGLGSATWTTPGPNFLLNGLVPDSTATGRIGRKVVMKSLLVRVELRLAATSTGGGFLRYLVVYDRQSNAAAPAVTDILLADTESSPMNLSNKDRFQILAEGTTQVASANGNFCSTEINIYKKLDHPVQYNAGIAGTIADIQTGAVYILFAQSGGIGTAAPFAIWRSRVRYSDN